MSRATVLNIIMPRPIRIERIVQEYGVYPREVLCESIRKIEKRFGYDRTKKTIKLMEDNRLYEAVELLLDYYDKNYKHGLVKYEEGKVINVETQTADVSENAELLLKKAQSLLVYE